jgi:hypothetical protein
MTRRRAIGCVVFCLALIGVGLGLLYLSGTGPITRGQLARVKVGMSRDQVVATIGHPPGDYTSRPCLLRSTGYLSFEYEHWLSDAGEWLVVFDAEGMAINVYLYDTVPIGPPWTVAERIRRWAGL